MVSSSLAPFKTRSRSSSSAVKSSRYMTRWAGVVARAESEVENLHERDQVAERRRLDHAQLVERLAGIGRLEHPDQAAQGLQEPRGLLALPGAVEGVAASLSRKCAHQLVSSSQGRRRDVALFIFFHGRVDDLVKGLLFRRESLAIERRRPLGDFFDLGQDDRHRLGCVAERDLADRGWPRSVPWRSSTPKLDILGSLNWVTAALSALPFSTSRTDGFSRRFLRISLRAS